MIVFLWGAIVYGIGGYISDRFRKRFLVVVAAAPTGLVGYSILLASKHVSVGVQYFSCFLISTGIFLCAGGNMAWLSLNCAPDGKRAASVGITLTLTNIGKGCISGYSSVAIADNTRWYCIGPDLCRETSASLPTGARVVTWVSSTCSSRLVCTTSNLCQT
jgi:hypothetical protein